jgi:hypothetical protein
MRGRSLAIALALLLTSSCGGGDDGPTDAGPDAIDATSPDADPVIPTGHPRIYVTPNRDRLNAALAAGAAPATRFRDLVDTELAGADHYAYQAWYSALLGTLTGEQRYCDDAVARVEAWVAAEEVFIAAGERPDVAFDSYLYVGDHIGDLALTYDWCFDTTTAAQRQRWLTYANQAVWNVWHPMDATWGGASFPWSGWSIDNPSNNYYYSFLRATMLLGLAAYDEVPEAAGWVTMFRDAKIGQQLVPTFAADLEGGCSREGSGYGVAMAKLFELYDWWRATTGERIDDLGPHARDSLVHFLHMVVPTRDRIAPVGDHARDSTAALFDYHRNYVQILTYLYRDDARAAHGKWFLENCSVPEMGQGFMYVYDFLYDDPSIAPATPDSLYPAYHGAGTGQIYFRSAWDTDATWVHFIAGPYSESHAHHDQGSFLIYRGEWLAYDQNVESHSGLRQEELSHNLVRIDDGATVPMIESAPETMLLALEDEPAWAYAAADVTPVYGGDPSVVRSQRELVYLRPDAVVVFDRVDAAAGTTRVWQLNSPIAPTISGTGNSIATFAGATATLVVRRVLPVAAAVDVIDWVVADTDMNGGFRLDVADASGGTSSRFLHVLSVDGTVTAVVADDAATRTGAIITFADGKTATVHFEIDAVGGDLELLDSGGGTIVQAELPAAVEAFPVFAP